MAGNSIRTAKYEQRQLVWLFVSFAAIALMALAIMAYGAVLSGWRLYKR